MHTEYNSIEVDSRKSLSTPPSTLPERVPCVGELVQLRSRRWLVEEVVANGEAASYYDPRSVAQEGPTSVLHAKAVIADEETVFITSANLTEAALDRNIETGLLLRDQTIAATALSYFQGLIDRGRLRVLPAT